MKRITLSLIPLALAAAALAACGGGGRQDAASPAGSAQAPAASAPAVAQTAPTPLTEAPAAAQAPAPEPQPVEQPASAPPAEEPPAANPEFAGAWRAYSARIFYDEGGAGTVDTTITRELELYPDGTWYFGSSSGTYEVSDISADDWARWGVDPYGPSRKITLFDWNGGVADGPVEESGGGIDFLWAIYREGPPTIGAPGTVWMKFGHA